MLLRKHSTACFSSLIDQVRNLSAQLPSLLPNPETGLLWGRRDIKPRKNTRILVKKKESGRVLVLFLLLRLQ